MHRGYIRLWRKLNDWEWISDPNVVLVFIHLLLDINFKDKKWHGIDIPRGSVLVGRKSLAKKVGLSEQSIRTALTKLKSTNEITIKSTNKYSLISINNYNLYQQTTNKTTDNQPAINQQSTTTNNVNKEKNEKKINTYADFIKYFNQWTKKKFGTNKNNLTNFEYWSKQYTQEQMKVSIKLAMQDEWWKDKLTPERLLRQRNANGACDNIGDLLNKYEGKYELNNT